MKETEINVLIVNATHGSAFLGNICPNRRNGCPNCHSRLRSLTIACISVQMLNQKRHSDNKHGNWNNKRAVSKMLAFGMGAFVMNKLTMKELTMNPGDTDRRARRLPPADHGCAAVRTINTAIWAKKGSALSCYCLLLRTSAARLISHRHSKQLFFHRQLFER
jgi:hypothetical protein